MFHYILGYQYEEEKPEIYELEKATITCEVSLEHFIDIFHYCIKQSDMVLSLKFQRDNKLYTIEGLLKPMFEVLLRDYEDILIHDASYLMTVSSRLLTFHKDKENRVMITTSQLKPVLKYLNELGVKKGKLSPIQNLPLYMYKNKNNETINNVISLLKTLGMKEETLWDL